MKNRFFLFLLVFVASNARATGEQEAEVPNQKKGEEIWLEEKISPTTTWVENLVKPLTIWMEHQINSPELSSQIEENNEEALPKATPEIGEVDRDRDAQVQPIVGPEQAAALAQEYVQGHLLYLKLLSESNHYRVKLISTSGEIHVFYVNAVSGDILLRINDRTEPSTDKDKASQRNRSATGTENQEREARR